MGLFRFTTGECSDRVPVVLVAMGFMLPTIVAKVGAYIVLPIYRTPLLLSSMTMTTTITTDTANGANEGKARVKEAVEMSN